MKKRSLIDAARESAREKRSPGQVHQFPPQPEMASAREESRSGQVQAPSRQPTSLRNLVLVTIAIGVGFIGGLLVNRYLRIL